MVRRPSVVSVPDVARQLKRRANRAVKQLAAGYDMVRRPAPGLVVLAYHRVGGNSGLEVDLDPGLFAAQMQQLSAQRRAVDIDRGLELVQQSNGPPSVVITFDDGTVDFIDHALPALVAAGVPATYYVATQFIDEQQRFPDRGTPMTWAGLAEAASTGLVTIGSHTHSHAVMDKLSPAGVENELRRSKELIEDHLGRPAHHFAYPKGVFGGSANEMVVGQHFRSAALANCAVNRFGATNPLRLDRFPIQRSDGMAYFARKCEGGMALEGRLRAILNRRRYDSAMT